jgi:UDP:flavonoid glycosyltransferase YjiC (YdhE family)
MYISSEMIIDQVINTRILLSPLNWGMGHVSRCIGLIDRLRSQNNTVIVACSEAQQAIFGQYFPDLTFIDHDGYPFEFKGKGNFGMDLMNKSPSLYRRLKKERIEIESYVKEHLIDLILSDHRYGFRSDSVKSIFIAHQVNLPVRIHEKIVGMIHNKYLSSFDHIWVLDYPDFRLAGDLSESKRSNVSYIGPFSRFSRYDRPGLMEVENVLIASGPNVYAQKLIDEVCSNTKFSEDLIVLHNGDLNVPEGIRTITGDWLDQDACLLKAKHIISRSGYSTIMDCLHLSAATTFIPTKGQREQEYLAKIHS